MRPGLHVGFIKEQPNQSELELPALPTALHTSPQHTHIHTHAHTHTHTDTHVQTLCPYPVSYPPTRFLAPHHHTHTTMLSPSHPLPSHTRTHTSGTHTHTSGTQDNYLFIVPQEAHSQH